MSTGARGRLPGEAPAGEPPTGDATTIGQLPDVAGPGRDGEPASRPDDTRPEPTVESDAPEPLTAQRTVPEEQLRRALADLDNVRKRSAREVARQRVDERAAVVAEWLPIVDDLQLALDHAGDRDDPVIQGVRGVYQKAEALLARLGYPPFDDTGRPFDAARHEVVAVIDDPDVPPGTIVATVRPGYGTSEHLLRPAGVVVSRAV